MVLLSTEYSDGKSLTRDDKMTTLTQLLEANINTIVSFLTIVRPFNYSHSHQNQFRRDWTIRLGMRRRLGGHCTQLKVGGISFAWSHPQKDRFGAGTGRIRLPRSWLGPDLGATFVLYWLWHTSSLFAAHLGSTAPSGGPTAYRLTMAHAMWQKNDLINSSIWFGGFTMSR